MAIITTAEVKTFLQISGTAKDALIAAIIPEVEGYIKEECNNSFLDSEGAEAWPSGIKIVAAKMIGYDMAVMSGGGQSVGLKSESQGGYSYSKGDVTGAYPDDIMKALGKWRLARVGYAQKAAVYRERRFYNEHELAEGEYTYGIPGAVNAND